jgi:hypothetical protein
VYVECGIGYEEFGAGLAKFRNLISSFKNGTFIIGSFLINELLYTSALHPEGRSVFFN